MARVLVPVTPLLGHLGPLLTVASSLQAVGHHVDVLTAERYRTLVHRCGLGFRALSAGADPVAGPSSDRSLLRWAGARDAVITRFIAPLRHQAASLQAALAEGRHDAIVADTAFLGTLPLLLTGVGRPETVLGVSVTPLSLISNDAAPFGSRLRHSSSRYARERNRQVNWLLHRGPLRPLHDALDEAMRPWDVPERTINYFDVVAAFDQTFQLAVPELEYSRSALPSSVRCVGPVTPTTGFDSWPPEVDQLLSVDRPVVLVTQGTVDNVQLDRLVRPAIQALDDSDVSVVVTTGTTAEDLSDRWGPLPGNVVVASYLPYDRLLPRCRLMITNGGWGGVQQAARHGVPVVVAGATEEKPEVGARVAWSGLGVDLRTGRPGSRQLRRAAAHVLGTERFRDRATEIRRAAAARPDPSALITAAVPPEATEPSRSESCRSPAGVE